MKPLYEPQNQHNHRETTTQQFRISSHDELRRTEAKGSHEKSLQQQTNNQHRPIIKASNKQA